MKQTVIIIILATTIHTSALGQYSFNTTLGVYEDLSDPISLNDNSPWDYTDIFPIYFNFPFQIGTQTFTAVNVMAGGGLSFPGQGNIQLRVYGHPDSGYLLEDEGQVNSVSSIDYKISGDIGEQILKIQWRRAAFRDWCPSSTEGDYCNFQIWLYESDGKIEVRFGEYSAQPGAYGQPDCNTGTDGPQFIFEFDECNNALSLTGNANLPSYDFRNHCIWQPGVHVSGTPSSGIIYNLTRLVTSVDEATKPSIEVFPNPTRNIISIDRNNRQIYKIEVRNLLGEIVKSPPHDTKSIDLNDLPNGAYLIDFLLDDTAITKKVLKQ